MRIRKVAVSGVCLALCMLLPFITGQVPQIGNALCPMHIPVLLCGLLCGWGYGAAVGFMAPLLRFALFGMPPIYPIGIAMCFELAAYGAVSGILYQLLPKKNLHIYTSLIGAMLAGRVVWGIVKCVMAAAFGLEFGWQIFVSSAFLTAIPGMICHIVLIPPVVMACHKAGIVMSGQKNKKEAKAA